MSLRGGAPDETLPRGYPGAGGEGGRTLRSGGGYGGYGAPDGLPDHGGGFDCGGGGDGGGCQRADRLVRSFRLA